ncbi:hypothetical protein RGQ29_021386 [Quercus rubra]|uniref:Helicase C-terminal domain-containing protein n=1 Tax=Quercus rubra TaxID=3512 RepID=A0AAN7FEL2_QUERU|nr:hypothetical protein RGQ29_021386 [Quercus rubra]
MAGQLFQFMEIKVQQRGTGSSVLSEFKAGKSPIMTATDVAARGLEVKDVKYVINYDFPASLRTVRRIGRTGRAGQRTAYTFFTAANARFAKELISILEELDRRSVLIWLHGHGAPPPPSVMTVFEIGEGVMVVVAHGTNY